VRAKRGCPEERTLLGYAEGLLSDDERAALERHLEACEGCRAHLAEVEGVRRALRAAGSEGAPEFARDDGAPGRRRGGGGTRSRDCQEDELLAAYADGSLEGRRASRIEGHLARCRSCLAEVADLISMAGAPGRVAPDRAVEMVLSRLDRDRRTAVVRLAERSIVLIRDFVGAGLPEPQHVLVRLDRIVETVRQQEDDAQAEQREVVVRLTLERLSVERLGRRQVPLLPLDPRISYH